MKKIVIFVLVFLTTILLSGIASAQETPSWLNKTAWEQNGYVYGVGTAAYSTSQTDAEFAQNFQTATSNSIKNIKDFLKLKNIVGYQVIAVWYDDAKMYVLGAVRRQDQKATPDQVSSDAECLKEWWTKQIFECEVCNVKYVYAVATETIVENDANTAHEKAKAKAQQMLKDHLKVTTLNGFFEAGYRQVNNQLWVLGRVPATQNQTASAQSEQGMDEHAAYETALQNSGIDTVPTIPKDWWGLYKEGMKVFVFNDQLYAIGWTKLDPKYKENPTQQQILAERGAVSDAQRNALAALQPGIKKIKSPGNWEVKISGIIKDSALADVENNPFIVAKKEMYVLIVIAK